MGWAVPIVVAVITGPLVVLLEKLRKENTTQHAESRNLLDHLVMKVDEVREDLHEHREEFKTEFKNHIATHHKEK